ncbi:unnamed protein product, partial [Effrenium voratum]
DWNIANPSLQVKKHDHIVQVNKVNFGADAMRQEMQQEGVLELVIRSRDHQRRPSSKASATPHSMASEMSPVALLGRVGASPKEKSDVASADGDSALGLEVVLEVQHLESSSSAVKS